LEGRPLQVLEKLKCAIYARVSTDKQGDSIDNQISQCQEYISRLGEHYDTKDLVVYRDEAVSGYYTSVFDRAEMKQAIKDARDNKFKLLVFKEVSRVGRDKQENPAIIGMFEQYGVRIVAINDNYDSLNKDNITFDILSVLSEQESKKISSRVSSARKQRARRGQWGGEPPIGYRLNTESKKLEVDPEWKDVPVLIFDHYVNKGLGTFKVAEHLNKRGITTKKGNLWSRETINKVIRNQVYIGNVVYGTRRNKLQREYDDSGKMTKKKVQIKIDKQEWQVAEDAHEPLIDKETYYSAQRILLSKSHNRTPRRAYHPLTGLLFCGKCNEGMVCQKRKHENREYRYYICKTYHKYGRDVCEQANINAEVIEKVIISTIREKLQAIPSSVFSISANKDRDIEKLMIEIKQRQNKRDKSKRDQIDIFGQRDLFDEDTYQEEMLNIKRKISLLDDETMIMEKQIEAIHTEIAQSTSLEHYIHEFSELNIEDLGRLRVLLHELIKRVTLSNQHLAVEYHYDFTV
jgi:DNA invertase Pin-like site-specific DNA recombinase